MPNTVKQGSYYRMTSNMLNKFRYTPIPIHLPFLFHKIHPHPESIQLSINDACNYGCEMCLMHSVRLKKDEHGDEIDERYYRNHSKVSVMKSDLFYSVADQIAELKIPEVNICGRGEPLLNPNAMEYIRHLKKAGINVRLTTNGSLLTRGMIDEFFCLLSNLSISLNAASTLAHKSLHHSKKSDFSYIVDMIDYALSHEDKFIKNPFRLSVTFVVSKSNFEGLDEILSLMRERKNPYICFGFCSLGVFSHTMGLALTREESEEFIKRLIQFKKENSDINIAFSDEEVFNYNGNPIYRTKDVASHIPCYAGFRFLLINADGSIDPCCSCRIDLGNLKEKRLKDIWLSKEYFDFRKNSFLKKDIKRLLSKCRCYNCGYWPENVYMHKLLSGRRRI